MPGPEITSLFEHMYWADARVLAALHSGRVTEEAIELYAHLLAAELVWLARIEGREQPVPVWPEPDLDLCGKMSRKAASGYQNLISALTSVELGREVDYANSAGEKFKTPVRDILLHVALHGAYHRGQIARIMRISGATPSPTDYIAFVRGTPAATRSDAEAPSTP